MSIYTLEQQRIKWITSLKSRKLHLNPFHICIQKYIRTIWCRSVLQVFTLAAKSCWRAMELLRQPHSYLIPEIPSQWWQGAESCFANCQRVENEVEEKQGRTWFLQITCSSFLKSANTMLLQANFRTNTSSARSLSRPEMSWPPIPREPIWVCLGLRRMTATVICPVHACIFTYSWPGQ